MNVQKIVNLFKASIPVVALDAPAVEERSTLEKIVDIGSQIKSPVYVWNLAEGMRQTNCYPESGLSYAPMNGYNNGGQDPILYAVDFIQQHRDKALFVLVDIHPYLGADSTRLDLMLIRKLKSLTFDLKSSFKRVILLGQGMKLASDLSDLVYHLSADLPKPEEIRSSLNLSFEDLTRNKDFNVALTNENIERLIRSAQGLTLEELWDGLRLATLQGGGTLNGAACEVIYHLKVEKLLKLHLELSQPPNVEIGGLQPLKQWITKRTKLFNASIVESELPKPKGLLLVGPPGTGKSLVAKTIGHLWNVPILKLDLGNLMSSFVGDSEANMRRLLKTAEAVAPCVLLIDEIEKAFAGSTGASTDSGVAQRMFGAFLTWMADKTAPVFVVATANDISNLPPELSRKGRFDEIFFVDLPSISERKEILKLHLSKYPVAISEMELERLAIASEQFSGAELEAAVSEAAIRAFDEERYPEIDLDDISLAISQTVPLAKSYQQKIEALRQWASTARRASLSEPEKRVNNRRASMFDENDFN